jgi:chromatin structure-remodeling complex subunit RSC9
VTVISPKLTPRTRADRIVSYSAYEIAKYWGETPPPREILEDMTAKGGDVRTRTLENYPPANPRAGNDSMLEDTDDKDEEQVTPKKEQPDEEPGSASRYPTRAYVCSYIHRQH